MPLEVVLVETARSLDAIDLIDDLRLHGFEADLADTPGAWEVEVEASLEEVTPILAQQLAAHGTPAAAVHAGGNVFLVEAAREVAAV